MPLEQYIPPGLKGEEGNANTMWKAFIEGLTSQGNFSQPATLGQLAEVEQGLGLRLPDELRQLLLESNGIAGEYGLGLVWPAERILSDNRKFRQQVEFKTLYMPFDPLLFFADAGNGDQFAFIILAQTIQRPDIFVWNHENDSRTWAAPSLQHYLAWWLSGKLTI